MICTKPLQYLLLGTLIMLTISCTKEEDPLLILSFEPTSGNYHDEVVIKGQQFNTGNSPTKVFFGLQEATITSLTANELRIKVPVGAVTGKITVKEDAIQSQSSGTFTVTAGSWSRRADSNLLTSYRSFSFSIGNYAYVHNISYTSSGTPVASTFLMYDPANNRWVPKKELSANLNATMSQTWSSNDRGYFLQYQKLWEYNPITNEWSSKKDVPYTFNTDKIVDVFYISSVNKAYAIMGNGDWYTYDTATDTWGVNVNAPFTGTLNHSNVQIAQGTADKGFFLNGEKLWIFDPIMNRWSQGPSLLNIMDDRDHAYSYNINNEFYVGTSAHDNFWVFKPTTNEWIQKAASKPFRSYPIYFSIANTAYMGMGHDRTKDYFIYDLHAYTPE